MPGLVLITRALQVAASIGVAKVVTTVVDNAVKGSTVGSVSNFAKAAHWTGSLVLSSMAVEQAKNHIERLVTTTADELEELQKKAEEKAEESTEK
jgi:hypothetical protein